jgi:hypothetical protein
MRIKFIGLTIILLLCGFWAKSQDIILGLGNYASFCTGTVLSVPVSLTGSWGADNQFILKLKEESGSGDTTVYITASNKTTPLLFQLPKIYASKKRVFKMYFKATVESTNPYAVSNTISVSMTLLPTIKIGSTQQRVNNQYGLFEMVYNEYTNAGGYRTAEYQLYSGTYDYTVYGKMSDSTIRSFGNSIYGEIGGSSKQTSEYKLLSIWHSCGVGQVVPPGSFTIKVNPIKIKIANLYPKIICEDRKINVNIDYLGELDPNQLYIEIANARGDTVQPLPTTVIDARNFTATIGDHFREGKYNIRIRANSPDLATDYVDLHLMGSPKIKLQWVSGATNPVDYNNPIWLRITTEGSNDNSRPTFLKLSDGTQVNYFGGVSGGHMADVTLYPQKTHYYKVDSVMTSVCGVSKAYSVIGEREVVVRDDFYLENLPKNEYCEGEKVRLKIKTNHPFDASNVFSAILRLYEQKTITVPVNRITPDSLEFTIPNASEFQDTFWQFELKIKASNPEMVSSKYWEPIKVYQKPTVSLINSQYSVDNPGITYLSVRLKGGKPGTLYYSNEQQEFSAPINEFSSEYPRELSFQVFPLKTTAFKISAVENTCGRTEYSPTLDISVNVVNNPKTIQLVKSPIHICVGGLYQVEFKTTGAFSPTDEFIVKLAHLTAYGPVFTYYEVGRGRGNIIDIQIPANIPITDLNHSGKFIVTSVQSEAENLPSYLRESICYITQSQTAYFQETFLVKSDHSYSITGKTIEILQGETVKVHVNSPNTTASEKYDIRINQTWYEHTRYLQQNGGGYYNQLVINFTPDKDTLLVLNALRNVCGITTLNDTIIIKVKKSRMKAAIIEARQRCQGNRLDVIFSVEGKSEGIDNNFKIYLKPNQNLNGLSPDFLRVEATIVQKSFQKYEIIIPDMPFEGNVAIDVVPVNQEPNFAKNYVPPTVFISKIHQIKLTALDGSPIAWHTGNRTRIDIRAETLNSENPFSSGRVVSINPNSSEDNSFGSSGKVTLVSVDAKNGNIYKLIDVENYCGYGTATGEVLVKQCYSNLTMPPYNYQNDYEYFSSNTIKSRRVEANKNTLFSATDSVELLPGFRADGQKGFKAEIGGCKVVK